jgi:hypothetical protein
MIDAGARLRDEVPEAYRDNLLEPDDGPFDVYF